MGKNDKRKVSADLEVGTEMTIYSGGTAFIRETSSVKTAKGIDTIALDMPQTADIDTIWSESPEMEFLEQRYVRGSELSHSALMERAVGKEVRAWMKIGEEIKEVSGTLLKIENGRLLIKNGSDVECIDAAHARIPFSDVEKKAALDVTVHSTADGERLFRTNYLASGFSWSADYVMSVEGNDVGIMCNANVTNGTDKAFKDASLTLVAGDVTRFRHYVRDFAEKSRIGMKRMDSESDSLVGAEAGSVGENYIYSVKRAVSLEPGEKKKLSLFSRDGGLEKRYQTHGDSVETLYRIENNKKNGLGEAMPSGTVRVYEKDSLRMMRFVGEQMINHVAKDEKLELRMGQPIDVKSSKIEKDYKVIKDSMNDEIEYHDYAYEIKMKNHKDERITMDCFENPYGDWSMIGETSSPVEKSRNQMRWEFEIPANSEKTLSYTIRQKIRVPKPKK